MANRFDEVIRLIIESEGTGDLVRMGAAVAELEKDFAGATPEIRGLLDELRRISDAKTAVAELKSLDSQLERNAAQLREAKNGLDALNAEFKRTDKSSADVKVAFQQAERAVRDLANEQLKLQRASADVRNSLKRAGVDAKDLAAAERQLADESGKVATKIKGASDAIRANRAESDRAAAAIVANNQRTSQSFNSTTQEIGFMRKALAALGVTFALTKLRDGITAILSVGDAAERTRIQLAQLYGGQAEGNVAFAELRKLARDTGQSFESVLDAAKKLKAQGLEPLDGTLKALIDQTAALGGSQETLTGIGLALGQMYAKQKIQTEEILQLVERGVPAFDLLAKVTGKQGTELQKLIQSGKLGRETIKALIDEIGRASEGAAAKNLGTLSGLVAQLSDQIDLFLETVANSGAADFFKKKLTALRDEITLMVEDGRLQTWAQETSDSITSVGETVSAVAEKWRGLKGAIDFTTGLTKSAFSATASAFTFVTSVATDGLNRIGLVSDQTRQKVENLDANTAKLAKETFAKTGDAARAVGVALGLVGEKADEAGTKVEKAGAKFNAVTGQTEGLGNQLGLIPDYFDGIGSASSRAAEELAKANQEVEDAEAKLQAARDAVVALSQANETGNDAWQDAGIAVKKAAEEVEAARKKVADLTGETAKAEAATQALGEAFATLKVTSQADLDNAAAAAEAAFETIVQASYRGEAAAADVTRAFAAYAAAERARVADGDERAKREVEQHIRIAASAAGLSAEYERLGQAGKKAGEDTAEGLGKAKAEIDAAAESAAKLGDAASTAADDLSNIAVSATSVTVAVNDAGVGLGFMTDEARAALAAAQGFDGIDLVLQKYADQIFATREELDAFTRSQQEAADAAASAADEIAKLTERLREQRDAATLSEAEQEQKRYEKELEHIQELAETAGANARAQAAELRALAEAEHRRKLAEIAEEARARRDSNADSGSSGGSGAGSGGRPGGGSANGGGFPGGGQNGSQQSLGGGVTYAPNITIQGGFDLTSNGERKKLAELLGRDVYKVIKDIQGRSQ